MAWYRIQLTVAEQEVVIAERESHPQSHVRRKMLVLWLLHCGLTRAKTATVAGLGRATVQRYVAAYREDGLDGLRQWDVTGPVSDPTIMPKPITSVAEFVKKTLGMPINIISPNTIK